MLRRLTTLEEEAAVMRAEAVRWHDGRVQAADEAVRKADEALKAARLDAAEAQRTLESVDARAAGLWAEYVHKVGPVAERYGRTKPPAVIPRQRGEKDAIDYLEEVATKVKYTAPARPLTVGVKAMFAIFGLVGGIVGAVLFRVLRNNAHVPGVPAGTWRDALPVVALVVLLACPVLAVVGAKKVADRRGVGLDLSTVVTVLVTGLATAGLIVAAAGLGS
ncbi:hypothetical protein GCM10010172_45310 [Paractinoplanes ferrugineus]|uniref:Uncharacterized protein n=1 Tax=Paractinoplanes ferrugineus TaxID=113564 RepID=A0A919J2B7_9ACTN|nr:hypothetical protein Afe05nite_29940 [Actinoplanes ferrugineus]